MFLLDQLLQITLAGDDVGEIEPREFYLLRQRFSEYAELSQLGQQPVVPGTLVFELEGADRVRDVFQRVFDGMRIGIHGVDAPFVAGAVMMCMLDAINRRVAQIDVRRGHIDFGAQNMRAFGVFAEAHFAEQAQVFGHAALAEGRILAGFSERTTRGAHLFGRLRIDIGEVMLDQGFGELVEIVEIIAGVIQMIAAEGSVIATQPVHRFDDRIDVFLIFLFRIGIVEAQMAHTRVIGGQAEIEQDRFGVAEMQIAVRLGRKARADFCGVGRSRVLHRSRAGQACPVTSSVFAGGEVGVDDIADEIGDMRAFAWRVF